MNGGEDTTGSTETSAENGGRTTVDDVRSNDVRSVASDFLERFFSKDVNLITADVVASDAHLKQWVDRLAHRQVSTVLPLMVGPKSVVWHGIARSESELRTLREGLEAFLGPTYADLSGARATIDGTHPVGAALLAYSGGNVLRFRADMDQVRLALNRMFALWDARPERTARDTRSPGVIRRAFEMALRAGDAGAAQEALSALGESGTLDATNDLFLQIQFLDAFRRWDKLLALPGLRDVLAVRRPIAVTDALLRAVYHTYLADAVRTGDGSSALRTFRDEMAPLFGSLLKEEKGAVTAEALTVIATSAAATGDRALLERVARKLVEAGGVGGDLAAGWLDDVEEEHVEASHRGLKDEPNEEVSGEEVSGEVDVLEQFQPLGAAQEAMLRGDPSAAVSLAVEAPPTPERALLLLQAAVLLPTLDSERAALEAVMRLADDEREALLGQDLPRRYYERLRLRGGRDQEGVGVGVTTGVAGDDAPSAGASETDEAETDGADIKTGDVEGSGPQSDDVSGVLPPPASWSEWLGRLVGDEAWPRSEVRRTAEQGVYEWEPTSLYEASTPEEVAERLYHIPNDRLYAFAEAFPYLLDAVQGDTAYPASHLKPIYGALLEHVVLMDAPTTSDLRVYVDLLPAMLQARLDEAEYTEIVDNWVRLVEAQRSSPSADLVLDGVDALVVHPCRSTEARLRALCMALAMERRYKERWDASDRAFLIQLGRECGAEYLVEGLAAELAEEVHGDEESDVLERLAGQYVAIYTLAENAARRAQEVVESLIPDVRVEVSHAHVGNKQLRAMAKNADVFVMVTARAKHAATGYITTHRGVGPLLEPAGKGTSSILRVLRAHASELPR